MFPLMHSQLTCKFPGIEFLAVPRIFINVMKCFLLLILLLRLALPVSAWEVRPSECSVVEADHCACCKEGQCPCLQSGHSTPAAPSPALPPRPVSSGDANFVAPATETPNFYSWDPKPSSVGVAFVEPVGVFDADVPLYLRHCAQLK